MGWGFDFSQNHPGLISAWSRIQLGWVNPIELKESGTYLAQPSLHYDCIYKISYGYPEGEYLLVEHRIEESFDDGIGGSGLLIWKIDENAQQTGSSSQGYPGQSNWPANGNHYKVALLQADEEYGLEKANDYGDPKDLWTPGMELLDGPKQFPNTDAYQGGGIHVTKNRIKVLRQVGDHGMSFRFVNPDLPDKDNMLVTSNEDPRSRKVAGRYKLSSLQQKHSWDRRKKRGLGVKGRKRKNSSS